MNLLLNRRQLLVRRAVCWLWGHDEQVINWIGVGRTWRCRRCLATLGESAMKRD